MIFFAFEITLSDISYFFIISARDQVNAKSPIALKGININLS